MKERDELWWANLDGETSPSEAVQFDRCLSHADRERNAGDLRMESALAEVLGAPVACPDDVWQRTLERVKQQERVEHATSRRRATRWVWRAVPIAATLLIVCAVALNVNRPATKPGFLALKPGDVSGLAARSQVTGGVQGVRSFMKEHAIPVALDPSDPFDGSVTSHHLLGVREDAFEGERVVQLFFDCGGQPAMLIIAKEQGNAAKEIAKGLAKGSVSASRAIGDVLVAVVGTNAPSDLISVINDNWPDPTASPEPEPAEQKVEPSEPAPVLQPEEPQEEAPKGLNPDSVMPENPPPASDSPTPVKQENSQPPIASTQDSDSYGVMFT